jgi:hypothetical protein
MHAAVVKLTIDTEPASAADRSLLERILPRA